MRIIVRIPLRCTGAGLSTADMTHAPETADTPQAGSTFHWTLVNRTGKPIYGNWSAHYDSHEEHSSHVEAFRSDPWQPDDVVGADNYSDFWSQSPDWHGHICYDHRWWDFPGVVDRTYEFRLEVDSNHDLFAYHTVKSFFIVERTDKDALTTKGDAC
ncbi:hypothetical protein R3Q06_35830 [Rhodococcus erythropolis]|uniref:hypothetical protein n=1 Tax=Rhodococcus erythropolis TaxID=1833 RepID=UPI002949590C|nr:hypothetical protein [Rhodococcus erythropolis]MDV6278741.1 hypothetical protein [Rhodococcus erythropolis]